MILEPPEEPFDPPTRSPPRPKQHSTTLLLCHYYLPLVLQYTVTLVDKLQILLLCIYNAQPCTDVPSSSRLH